MSERDREHEGAGEPDGEEGAERGPDSAEHRLPGYVDATRGEREIGESDVLAHEEALPEPGRHDFEPDVERIHRPIFREPRDPLEGREPAPWWLWALAALALFWGGWYLGRRGGDFGVETHTAYPEIREEIEEEAAERVARAALDPVEAGRSIYTDRCQSCHQENGRGVPGVFPPLIGSEWVTGPPEVPVLILLDGLQGPITVAGAVYNGAMPAWREMLTDAQIAAVATFIRQWEENEAAPVEPELVVRLRQATARRQRPWTAEELLEAARSPEIVGAGGTGAPAATAPGGRP